MHLIQLVEPAMFHSTTTGSLILGGSPKVFPMTLEQMMEWLPEVRAVTIQGSMSQETAVTLENKLVDSQGMVWVMFLPEPEQTPVLGRKAH